MWCASALLLVLLSPTSLADGSGSLADCSQRLQGLVSTSCRFTEDSQNRAMCLGSPEGGHFSCTRSNAEVGHYDGVNDQNPSVARTPRVEVIRLEEHRSHETIARPTRSDDGREAALPRNRNEPADRIVQTSAGKELIGLAVSGQDRPKQGPNLRCSGHRHARSLPNMA